MIPNTQAWLRSKKLLIKPALGQTCPTDQHLPDYARHRAAQIYTDRLSHEEISRKLYFAKHMWMIYINNI